MKKIWVPVMVASMAVSSIPSVNLVGNAGYSVVKAEELLTTTIDGMRIENGILTRYEGNSSDIVIPEGVVAVGNEAFRGKDIVNITIPESVTEIGSYSFSECRKLKKVTIKGTIDKINEFGFWYCEQLEEIDVSQVRYFGMCCFSRCDQLKSVDLANAQIVEANAFYNTAINSVTLNFTSKDSYIGETVFKNCKNLKKVVIKGKLTQLEEAVFQGCEVLEDIIIENTDNLVYIGRNAFDGTPWLEMQLNEADNHMLVLNHILVRYKPEVSYAGEYGGVSYFDGISYDEINKMTGEKFTYTEPVNAKMETVTIPGDITQIAGGAFYGAYSVEKVIFDPSIKQIEIGERAFDFTTWELEYMKNHNFMVIGGNLLKVKCNASEIEIPNGVSHIVEDVFMKSPSGGKLPEEPTEDIQRIMLPQTVKTLHQGDFQTIKEEIITPSVLEKYFEYFRSVKVTVKDIDTSSDAEDLLPGYEGTEKPTPTPSVLPTEETKPTKSPQVTNTPEPTATPQVTEEPKPTITSPITEEPKPTITSQITEEPKPTTTLKVTDTPKPTETIKPTQTPMTISTVTPEPSSTTPALITPVPTSAVTQETMQPTPINTPNPTAKPTTNIKINVKKAVIQKLKKASKTKIKVYMKKTEKVKGYQILISTDKKFKKNRKQVNTTKQSTIITKLKKGKTYYVKVRAYKLNGQKKVYGQYSNIKKIKM